MTQHAFPTRPVINVTQDEIDTAIRNDSSHCMIADALRAQYPDATSISVDLRTIRMTDPIRKKRYTWLTPLTAARVLAQWDQGINPNPFRQQLSSPAQVRPSGRDASQGVLGVRSQGGRHLPTVEGGKPIPRGALSAGATPRNTRGRKHRNRIDNIRQAQGTTKSSNGRQFGIRNLNLTPDPS